MPKRDKVLVTLGIGEKHRNFLHRLVLPNWQAYADRYGFDIVVFEQPLDTSERAKARSPAWQKLLILSDSRVACYRQVVWIDVDILIAPDAPDVTHGVMEASIGAVDQWSTPSVALGTLAMQRANRHWSQFGIPALEPRSAGQWHQLWGLPDEFEHVVQTGVMVLSPTYHRAIFEQIYNTYEDKPGTYMMAEMLPASYELQKAGLMQWIDPRFNIPYIYLKHLYFPFLLAPEPPPTFWQKVQRKLGRSVDLSAPDELARACAQAALHASYFLHFCGGPSEMWALEGYTGTVDDIWKQPRLKVTR